MTKILLISDTHGPPAPDLGPYLKETDEVWHAGDIGDLEAHEEWVGDKTFRAIWGNIDDHRIRASLPEIAVFEIERVRVLMIHIGGYPGRYSPKAREAIQLHLPDLFISGHSHILKIMRDHKYDLVHFNPGSCGFKGFHKVRTAIRFVLKDGKVSNVQVIELGDRGKPKDVE
jgi:putative phosphoesterase